MGAFGFTSIEEGAITAYRSSLDRIQWDLVQAGTALSGPRIDYADVIHAAAHLRLVIENTVFASLFSNRQLLLEAEKSLAAKRDMGDTRKLVRSLNEHYWPAGMLPSDVTTGPRLVPHPDAIPEAEYSAAWGRMSEVLHGQNPYLQKKREPREIVDYQTELVERLHATLDYHFIYLPGNEILYGRIVDGTVKVQALQVG